MSATVKKWTIGIIVVLLVIWIGYLLIADTTEAPTNETRESEIADDETTGNGASLEVPVPGSNIPEMIVDEVGDNLNQPDSNIITYTDSGFSPASLTVKKGEVVTFVNESSRGLWVASAIHPTHEIYPAFDQRTQVPAGESYAFTFDRVGEWRYHNHVGPSHVGTIIVE